MSPSSRQSWDAAGDYKDACFVSELGGEIFECLRRDAAGASLPSLAGMVIALAVGLRIMFVFAL